MPWRRSADKRVRLVAASLVLFSLPALPARAVPARPQDAAEQALPLQLEVFLNGRPTRLIAGFIRSADGRMSAKRSELADIGVKAPGDGGPDSVVALDAVGGLAYRYDEQNQSIRIDAPDELLIGREYRPPGEADEAPPARKGLGAVVNYNLFTSTMTQINAFRPTYQGASASLDARLFSPYGTLSQSAILGSTLTNPAHGLRLDTTLSYSDQETLLTYNAGDTISSGLGWTRPIRMAGLQMQRNFGLRPDLVTLPLPVLSGTAAVPSTLDVYVNNVKAYSQDVQAGPYRITDLPLTGGGTARVVLRDATGRQIEKDMQFFASRLLMRPGFTDYSAEVGLPRRGFGSSSWDYATNPVANASLRHGLFDWLTVEAHAEASQRRFANLGIGAVTRVFDRGILSAAIQGSRSPFGVGAQVYGSFETRFRDITVNVTTQRAFGHYDDLASITASVAPGAIGASVAASAGLGSFAFLTTIRPPRELDRISIGAPVPFDNSMIGLSMTRLVNADSTKSFIGSVNWSRNIVFDASVFLTAYTNIGARRDSGVFIGLTAPLGPKTVASVGATSRGGQLIGSLDASRVLDLEEGSYGWRIHDTEGSANNTLRSAAASYRSRWARLEAGASQQGRSATATLEASGAVATMGNGVFFSNRIDDAFAIVDAAAPDVGVYHENRLIGRTDSSGRLLVPYLRSYQRNRLSIDTTNLPVNADAAATQEVVVPAYRNGVRVDFGVKPTVAGAIVILTGPDGKFAPVGAQGSLEGSNDRFVVGYDGRAYVTGLGATNIARLSLGLSECRARFDYQPSQDRQVVIGPVACQ